MSALHLTRDKGVAIGILAAAFVFYAYNVMDVIANARTWVDEVTYLIKSWTYITGQVAPYSDQDPTWYMPLYFYELGLWQKIFGPGITQGRILSACLGTLSGLLVFDITRRVTGNWTASAFAATALLTVPSVIFYFGTATPIATVSLLLLLTVRVAVTGLGRSSLWRSLCLGALFAALYFYRQNMVLALLAIAPVYLLSLRQSRLSNAIMILVGMMLVSVPVIMLFPERLVSYAIRLPLITPLLSSLNMVRDPLLLIEANTAGDMGLGLALNKVTWQDAVDAFLLPYAGLIASAGSVLVMASGKLRSLWVAPVIFIFLAATHYIGSLDYCQTCILPYTASFAGIGALCAGLAMALASYTARKELLPGSVLMIIFAAVIIGLSQTASGLATRSEYRFYPAAMLTNPRPIPEQDETVHLAAFIRENTAPGDAILPIHDLITVPYAVFLADRPFPAQGLNLRHSYRKLKPNLTEEERTATRNALQTEGLWTDEILEDWIDTGYDTIIFQVDPRDRDSLLESRIERSFDRTASTGFRGWNVHLYTRKLTGDGKSLTEPAP